MRDLGIFLSITFLYLYISYPILSKHVGIEGITNS